MPSQGLVPGLGNRLSHGDLSPTPLRLSQDVPNENPSFYNLYEPWPPAYADTKNVGQMGNEQINLTPNEVKSAEITDQVLNLSNEPGQPNQPDYYPEDGGSGQNVDQNTVYQDPGDYHDDYRNDENSQNPHGTKISENPQNLIDKHLIPPPEYAQDYQSNELNSNRYENRKFKMLEN